MYDSYDVSSNKVLFCSSLLTHRLVVTGLFEYFIGLSDDETEGEFLWEDGNATNYTKWNANDHEQNNQGKNCVVLDVESREWTNANCNKPYKYICEKRFVNYGG